jgi:hypothetical protein
MKYYKTIRLGNKFFIVFSGWVVVLITQSSFIAQQKNLPLNFQLNQELTQFLQERENTSVHTGFKPYNESAFPLKIQNYVFDDTSKFYYDFTELLFKKHLLEIHQKDVNLMVDPLFDLSLGETNNNYINGRDNLLYNTRGFRVMGDITSKFSFETRFFENQFFYPLYIDSIADARGVGFGYGRSKVFKDIGHDVGNSQGYISYSPIQNINLQLGHGKFFVGNGYRSLLLSDHANSFPYMSASFNLFQNKLVYKTINTWMQSLNRIPATTTAEALFKRKAATFHYLSFKPNKNLEIGVFEATIFKQYEEGLGVVPVHYSFYVPVIGFSTGVNGLQNENNTLLGLNASYKLGKSIEIYGQFAIDDVNKMGQQLGAKYYNCFGLKRSWLILEFNRADNYMYTHTQADRLQNYSHTNQELAHPIGAGFSEIVSQFYVRPYDRVNLTAHVVYSKRQRDGGSTFGENILLANNLIMINITPSIVNSLYLRIEASYKFNVKTNMEVYVSGAMRNMNYSEGNPQKENFLFFGIRTNLSNFYFDI